MPNENCLEGLACPKCGYDARLQIVCTVLVDFTDDGAVSDANYEYESHSQCDCYKCGHSATVADFREGTVTFNMQRLKNLMTEYNALMEKRDIAMEAEDAADIPCVEQIDKSIDDIRDAVFDTVYDITEAAKAEDAA